MYKKGSYIAFMTKQPEVHDYIYRWKIEKTQELLTKE